MAYRSGQLAMLKVEYVYRSGSRLHLGKGTTIKCRFRLTDTVHSFLDHLRHSFIGLQSTSSNGKELYLVKKGEHTRLDTHKHATLESYGVENGDYMYLQGYKPLSRIKFPIEVTGPDGQKLSIDVLNTTTIQSLRHKIQNETGIHESEFLLYHKSRKVSSSSKTIEFYSGKHSSKEWLRVRRQTLKSHDERGLRSDTLGCCLGNTSSYALGQAAEKDSAYRHQKHMPRTAQRPEGCVGLNLTSKLSYDASRVQSSTPYSRHQATQYPFSSELVTVEPHFHTTQDEDMLSKVPDAAISEYGLAEIRKEMVLEWGPLAIRLGLSSSERQSIKKDNPEYDMQKLSMFLKWKQKCGNEATWRALLKEVVAEGDREFAWKIVRISRQRKNSDSMYGAHGCATPSVAMANPEP